MGDARHMDGRHLQRKARHAKKRLHRGDQRPVVQCATIHRGPHHGLRGGTFLGDPHQLREQSAGEFLRHLLERLLPLRLRQRQLQRAIGSSEHDIRRIPEILSAGEQAEESDRGHRHERAIHT